MSTKHTDLIDTLLERTSRRELRWEVAADEDEFVVNLTRSSIAIKEVPDRHGGNQPDYVLTLHDETGRPVDRVRDADLDYVASKSLWFEKMQELYVEARRACYGADEVLDAALAELKSRP